MMQLTAIVPPTYLSLITSTGPASSIVMLYSFLSIAADLMMKADPL